MNFDFPDELIQLRDQARRFLAEKCPPSVPRRVLDSPDEPYAADLWQQAAEMGWQGAAIPEAYGGAGLGRLAACVLAEELGRAVAPVPFSSSVYLATEAILLHGSESQKQAWLPKLATGEVIGTFAMAEAPGPAANIAMTAAGDRITGTKLSVPDGDVADFAVVATAGAPGLLIVDLNGPGVTRTPVATFDPTRSHAHLTFAAAPADPLPGTGAAAIRNVLDHAAVPMAFEQVGNAQAALDMANAYAKQRFAFGRPIGSFQAIKHKIADMYIQVELARSNAYYGAWAAHTGAAELPVAACVARIAATEAGWFATKENVQVHGGMGFTWQMDCHLYYRRAKVLALNLGGAREWKRRLVQELRARNATGQEAA